MTSAFDLYRHRNFFYFFFKVSYVLLNECVRHVLPQKCLPRLNSFFLPCWPEGKNRSGGHDAFTKHNIPARRWDIREETYDQTAARCLAENKLGFTKCICKNKAKQKIHNAGIYVCSITVRAAVFSPLSKSHHYVLVEDVLNVVFSLLSKCLDTSKIQQQFTSAAPWVQLTSSTSSWQQEINTAVTVVSIRSSWICLFVCKQIYYEQWNKTNLGISLLICAVNLNSCGSSQLPSQNTLSSCH